MPAYMVEHTERCRCGKKAVVEVFNHANAHLGWRCRKCGAALVALLNKDQRVLAHGSRARVAADSIIARHCRAAWRSANASLHPPEAQP